MKWSRTATALVGAAIGSLGLVACGSPALPNDLPEGFVPLDEGSAASEYREAIEAIPLPLPDGRAYPDALPANFLPEDGYLQEGGARNQAWFTWLCAWEADYLNASDDAQRQHAAEMISEWPEMHFYQEVMVDPERGWVANVVTPLELGDPSGVRTDFANNCGDQFPTVAS